MLVIICGWGTLKGGGGGGGGVQGQKSWKHDFEITGENIEKCRVLNFFGDNNWVKVAN